MKPEGSVSLLLSPRLPYPVAVIATTVPEDSGATDALSKDLVALAPVPATACFNRYTGGLAHYRSVHYV